MTALAGLATWAVGVVVIAGVARGRRGTRLGVGLAVVLLAVPPLVDGLRIARFALAVLAVLCLFRALDLARQGASPGFGARLAHLVSLFDTRRARPRPPGVDRSAALRLVVATVCFAAAFEVVIASLAVRGPAHYAVQWPAVAVMAFAGFEILGRWRSSGAGAGTARCPRCCRRTASRLSSAGAPPRPSWRASPPAPPSMPMREAWPWMALILVERRLEVRFWPAARGRLWTLASLGALSPLFLEPFIRLFLSHPHP